MPRWPSVCQRRAHGSSSANWPRPRRTVREEPGVGGVAERAQHPRHILHRRLLLAPLGDRPGRLAFEVEQVEVALGPEHLAEVIVAVDALLRDGEFRGRRGLDPIDHLLLVVEQRLRARGHTSSGSRVAPPFMASLNASNAVRACADALRPTPGEILGREWLRAERGIAGVAGEREVHFRRSSPERLRSGGISRHRIADRRLAKARRSRP